jgi:hypothetical protein
LTEAAQNAEEGLPLYSAGTGSRGKNALYSEEQDKNFVTA